MRNSSEIRRCIRRLAQNLTALEIVLTLITAGCTVYLCRRAKSFPAAFTLCIFAGLLVARHSYIQDCALLLLIPAFLEPESSFVRQLSLVLLTPFPYFLLLAEGPWGLITPVLFLLWFAALAADACGLIPRESSAGRLPQTAWSLR
jgi:hypothetical protein